MLKKIFLGLLFTALMLTGKAQSLAWGFATGGTLDDRITDYAFDSYGNIYVTGFFENTVDFDPGTAVVNLVSSGGTNVFVAKYSSTGSFVWAFKIATVSISPLLAINNQNELFLWVGVDPSAAVDFDPGNGTTTNNGKMLCLAKYNYNGDLIGFNSFGNHHVSIGICIDPSDNVYITGCTPQGGYAGTTSINFETGNSAATLIGDCSFITKLSSSGSFVFTKRFTAGILFQRIIVDGSNNIIVAGKHNNSFSGSGSTVDFDPGTGNTATPNHSDYSLFLAKYNNIGDYLWVNAFVNLMPFYNSFPNSESFNELILRPDNSVYLIGGYSGQLDLNFSTNSAIITAPIDSITGSMLSSTFVARYAPDGSYITHIEGKYFQGGTIDVNSNLYTIEPYGNYFNGFYYGALRKFDQNLGLITEKFAPTGSNKIKMGLNNNLYIWGDYDDDIDLDPDQDTLFYHAAGVYNDDFFLVKYYQTPTVLHQSQSQSICLNSNLDLFVNEGGTGPFTFQWKKNGVPLSGQDSNIYSITTADINDEGIYSCLITNDYGQIESNTIQIKTIVLTVSAGTDKTICQGQSTQLLATGSSNYPAISGTIAYNWSPASGLNNANIDNPTANPTTSTQYVSTIHDNIGCTKSDAVMVNVQVPFNNQRICIVSVDQATGKNKIYWEKTAGVGTEYYLIYKENGTNNYTQIGNVPASQPGEYIDLFSVPEVHGDKYKITVLDTCGNESSLGYYHKTINLTIAAFGSTMGLNWDDYVDESGDYVPFRYYIYRGTSPSSLTLFDSVSGSFNSFNDVNVYSLYYYMIGVKKAGGCNNAKSEFIAFSNKIDNSSFIGIKENDFSYGTIQIFPNPMSVSAMISIPDLNWNSKDFTLKIIDMTGKIVRSIDSEEIIQSPCTSVNPFKYSITRGELKAGMYFIELRRERTYRGKFLVE